MKLFIGSTNQRKIDDWREYFPAWEILSYKDLDLEKIEVEEGIVSLEENAKRKALAWAAASGYLTLSDDTGFFVNALGGFPGVSVKRWGGKFAKEMSRSDLLRYLQKEIENIEDLSAYFESAYAIANPSGKVRVFSDKLMGKLDRSLFEENFQEDATFGFVFKPEGIDKAWRRMTLEERKEVDAIMIKRVEEILREFI